MIKEQLDLIDAMAKQMRPTRNGNMTPVHFIQAVEMEFRHRKWDWSAYCKAAYENHCARVAARKGFQKDDLTES
jgi:hypothetical protein